MTADTIRLFPSLAIAAQRRGLAAVCRLWLLTRAGDGAGRGVVDLAYLRSWIVDDLGVYSWRRVRQLLTAGDPIFWRYDRAAGRLWLRSPGSVARSLDLERLRGRTVDIPLTELTGGAAAYNRAVYAAWHAGRRAAPVSRAAITEATGIPERTQRHYDQQGATQRRVNIALGAPADAIGRECNAADRGHAAREFYDARGARGTRRAVYLAHQLPNSYQAPYEARRSRRQREINRSLSCGLMGHGERRFTVIYHRRIQDAARAHNNGTPVNAYWLQRRTAGANLWHYLPPTP